MESVLILSSSAKSAALFTELLRPASFRQVITAESCGEARRLLLERDFDLVVINAPLRDESGESLARHIASGGVSQVILVVKSEYFDAVAAVTEDDGVLTVAKPINRAVFWSALKLAGAAQSRLRRAQSENSRLKQKIEDLLIVDRAKCILISYLNMSEQDAHRYIEKQSMDMRMTRRQIAEGILKTYDN
jgi:AmiR/NasT family two-component response regulator